MSLEDERAIETLIRRFALLNDAGRWEDLADLFAEDAIFARPSAPDAPIRGRAAILEAFRSRPPRTARHLVCNTVVTLEGADRAAAFSYSVLIAASENGGSVAVGAFEDRLVRIGGAWRFAERRGSTAFDGLTFAPPPAG